MASKYKINRSNYTIKSRHQLSNKGVIYERDFMTTTNLGGWDSGSIPYGEGNFRMLYRPKENARKKPRPGFWMKPSCENDGDYWTENCVSKTGVTEEDLIDIKTVHHTLLDFAYFGSCEELIKSTIRKILEIYPGEAYSKTPDATSFPRSSMWKWNETRGQYEIFETIQANNYYYFENPFEIDFFKETPNDYFKNFVENKDKYYIIANGEKKTIGEVTVAENEKPCDYGDVIAYAKIKVEGSNEEFLVRKIIDGSKTFGLYAPTATVFAIAPKESAIEEFFEGLDDFAKVLLDRDSDPIYTAELDWPHETDYGIMTYRRKITWPTTESGCIDASSLDYEKYVNELLDLARFYDEKYTNNLWRMLTHDSIKNMDLTFSNPSKDEDVEDYNIGTTRMEGLLWAFGRQFDEIKRRIDGIKHAINVSYDSDNNLPDYFLSDTLENSGWDVSNVDNGLDNETAEISWESGKPRVYSAAEANNLFLKNLKLNAKSILKKKGTREGIASLLGLFGLSENDKTYGFTISEKIYTVMEDIEHVGANEEFELTRLNGMKLSMIDGSREEAWYNEFDGLPFTYVENEVDKYIIPWFDRNLHYDGGTIFQSKGGWAKKDILKLLFDGESYEFDGENDYTYGESIKNITIVDTISELSAITQSRVYNGSVCYVDDISELSDYFYELSTLLTEDDTFFHYFILIDADKFDIIGGENSGWVCAADGLPEATEYRDKIILMESVIESYEANNPHNGYWQYDGGETFVERIRNPFGYHIEEQNKGKDIFGDEAFDCDNGLIPDFEEYANKVTISDSTDNKKVWFFRGETKNVITPFNDNDTLPYSVYDFESSGVSDKPTESSANAIINSKVMQIDFTVISGFAAEFRTYFEVSILPYLKQMIPSTTIWGYSIAGDGKIEDKTYMVRFRTTPSNANIVITQMPSEGRYDAGSKTYYGKKGDKIKYKVSAAQYHDAEGEITVSSNKTVSITLTPKRHTYTIVVEHPNGAKVMINGVERSSFTASYGTSVSWVVSAEGYITQSGNDSIRENDYTKPVSLIKDESIVIPCVITFRVKDTSGNTLSNANIEVNGRRLTGTTYPTKVDAEVDYKVTCVHYETKTGTFIATGDTTVNVVLTPVDQKTITIYTDPDTTKVLVSDDFSKNVELVNGVIEDRYKKYTYVTDEGQVVSYFASSEDKVVNPTENNENESEGE